MAISDRVRGRRRNLSYDWLEGAVELQVFSDSIAGMQKTESPGQGFIDQQFRGGIGGENISACQERDMIQPDKSRVADPHIRRERQVFFPIVVVYFDGHAAAKGGRKRTQADCCYFGDGMKSILQDIFSIVVVVEVQMNQLIF